MTLIIIDEGKQLLYSRLLPKIVYYLTVYFLSFITITVLLSTVTYNVTVHCISCKFKKGTVANINLPNVSRFERQLEKGKQCWYPVKVLEPKTYVYIPALIKMVLSRKENRRHL